ncbi:MAG: Mini-ribonuclease 3 [Clostridia bacterium]|nr:Mini-ribonuclease 3 [Clostridia bacterium]
MDSILNNDAYLKNALVLAYLGDAVFNLRTRDFLVKSYDYKPNQLNKMANSIVCAKNQADIMKILKQELNEREQDIAIRARNTHLNNNKAKNSTIEEYSLATQFEAVVGYWYLNNEEEKINNMFKKYVIEKWRDK